MAMRYSSMPPSAVQQWCSLFAQGEAYRDVGSVCGAGVEAGEGIWLTGLIREAYVVLSIAWLVGGSD